MNIFCAVILRQYFFTARDQALVYFSGAISFSLSMIAVNIFRIHVSEKSRCQYRNSIADMENKLTLYLNYTVFL